MDRRTFVAGLTTSICAPSIICAQTGPRVIIIGAGAAGLSAAYRLAQTGADVKIIEAAPVWGGRVARMTRFADFPIDLGAEWIHDDPTILGEILGQGETDLGVETIEYRPQTYQLWNKEKLRDRNIVRHTYAEVKFYRTTWFGFFEKFVLPSIRGKFIINSPVRRISYKGGSVSVGVADGQVFEADKVIVTVPISVLQAGHIDFEPGLSSDQTEGINSINFGHGLKVFLKFQERFYPDILLEGPITNFLSDSWDSKIFYDAAFRKDSPEHVLGLFNVDQFDLPLARLTNQQIVQKTMAELDEIFDGAPSRHLLNAHVQNWSKNPRIMGSYTMDVENGWAISDALAPIGNRIFFAGEALGGSAQSTVHGAAFSGQKAAQL